MCEWRKSLLSLRMLYFSHLLSFLKSPGHRAGVNERKRRKKASEKAFNKRWISRHISLEWRTFFWHNRAYTTLNASRQKTLNNYLEALRWKEHSSPASLSASAHTDFVHVWLLKAAAMYSIAVAPKAARVFLPNSFCPTWTLGHQTRLLTLVSIRLNGYSTQPITAKFSKKTMLEHHTVTCCF